MFEIPGYVATKQVRYQGMGVGGLQHTVLFIFQIIKSRPIVFVFYFNKSVKLKQIGGCVSSSLLSRLAFRNKTYKEMVEMCENAFECLV